MCLRLEPTEDSAMAGLSPSVIQETVKLECGHFSRREAVISPECTLKGLWVKAEPTRG